MIKIEKFDVIGFEPAIRGMRNPMNSWEQSDSAFYENWFTEIGIKDFDLMKKLSNAGHDHRKYMRMIIVYVDIVAPLYWWKEFDTYKVGTVANSCSTMHKIHTKKFTLNDFSHEHLDDDINKKSNEYVYYNGEYANTPQDIIEFIVDSLNFYRKKFLETKDKKYWYQMIQLLPSSYNQKRTVMLNYEVLANIYHSRKNHKLDEWREFCEWIKRLRYSELITHED